MPSFADWAGVDLVTPDGDDVLERLELVVASVHSKLRMYAAPMTRRMVAAVRNSHTDVLGHCTGRLVTGGRGTRPPSTFDATAVFTACRDHGVAVEINSRPERQDPPDDLIAVAAEAGALGFGDTLCREHDEGDVHAAGFGSMQDLVGEQAGCDEVLVVHVVLVVRVHGVCCEEGGEGVF